MINRILMELYDDYEKSNIYSLKEFTKKTLPSDGTDKLFIGCVLIMFSRCNGFKARYSATREELLSKLAGSLLGTISKLAVGLDQVRVKKEEN